MPWEYLVALANQTNTDMWINIPEGATDAYVTALAGIIKNGGTVGGVAYPGLNPNLKVYLEYSNEVWGGIPSNQYYQEAAVQNTAANQPLSTFPGNAHVYDNADGTTTTDVYTAVGRRYLERTAEIGQIFQSVLGADPTHQRLRPVLGWQENNYAFYPPALAWFEHFFGPAVAAFYGMGNANYWDPTDYSSVDAIISTLQQQETAYAIPNAVDFTTLATYYGLKNVSYEGGPSIGADGNHAPRGPERPGGVARPADGAARLPALPRLLRRRRRRGELLRRPVRHLDARRTSGPRPSSPSTATRPPRPSTAGTVDVANAAPVAVTAGIPVAAGAPTSFSATTDTLGQNFTRPTTGQQGLLAPERRLGRHLRPEGDDQRQRRHGAGAGRGLPQRQAGRRRPQRLRVVDGRPRQPAPVGRAQHAVDRRRPRLLRPGPEQYLLLSVPADDPHAHAPDAGRPAPGVAPGFEVGRHRATRLHLQPAHAGWTFSGYAGSPATASGFTSGNPNAPEGTQVGFLQGQRSAQSVADWPAGTYALTFDAAQAATTSTAARTSRSCRRPVVGTFRPSATACRLESRPRSPSPPGRTPSRSRGWTRPAATTPPSWTRSPSPRRARRPRLRCTRRCRRWATRGSRRCRPGRAATPTTRPARPGPIPAPPASPARPPPSPRPTRPPPRAPRSASSRAADRPRSRWAGPPAPTWSASRTPSAATSPARPRGSRCSSTARWWAPSGRPRRPGRRSPPPRSPSPPGPTPSSSGASTRPAASTTPPSSTPSPSPRRARRPRPGVPDGAHGGRPGVRVGVGGPGRLRLRPGRLGLGLFRLLRHLRPVHPLHPGQPGRPPGRPGRLPPEQRIGLAVDGLGRRQLRGRLPGRPVRLHRRLGRGVPGARQRPAGGHLPAGLDVLAGAVHRRVHRHRRGPHPHLPGIDSPGGIYNTALIDAVTIAAAS